MSYISELVKRLAKPLPYKWRIQSFNKDKTKAICTAFINARDVQDVLDRECDHGWQVSYFKDRDCVESTIVIRDEHGREHRRSDYGTRVCEDKTDRLYEQSYKSASSDAFKRAAVAWGVGRFLYSIKPVVVNVDQYKNPIDQSGNRIFDLTNHINSITDSAPSSKKTPNKKPVPIINTTTEIVTGNTKPATDGVPPKLTNAQLDSMVKYVGEGKIKEVEDALGKYTLTLAQRTVINSVLESKKKQLAENK